MITRFQVENFKSLVGFDLPPAPHRLGPFTCLIGLNGSGKSTLLQAFDFAAHIATGKVEDWLAQRNWRPSEVLTNLRKWTPVITFDIGFSDNGIEARWQARYNVLQARCTFEKVESAGKTLLELSSEKLTLAGIGGQWKRENEKLEIVYQGSVLSVLQLDDAHPMLAVVRDTLRQLKSLELLSPQLLRRRSAAARDIGVGGEKLSAFLAGLPPIDRKKLFDALKRFYPHLTDWKVKTLRAGWKELRFREDFEDGILVPASHINDGLLRIMAILAQAHSQYTILLFDEIENGINPELVEELVDFLMNCGKQVIVTTHSPLILNYIPDAVAKESVIMLYKTGHGQTRSVRFFDLPEMQGKLRALGPGEVFADTSLTALARELEESENGTPPEMEQR